MQESRILIMDDEVQERRRIGDFLLQKGYDVLALGNVQDAVKYLTDSFLPRIYDLICKVGYSAS